LKIEDEPKCRVLVSTSLQTVFLTDLLKFCLCDSGRDGNAYEFIAWL